MLAGTAQTATPRRRPIGPIKANRAAHQFRGLRGWWPVVEGRGGRAHDYSGYKNHGTLTAGPTWAPALPWMGGTTLTFAGGSSQYVDCAAGWLNGAAQATISVWMYKAAAGDQINVGCGGTDNFGIIWYSDGNVYFIANGEFQSSALSGTGWHHFVFSFNGTLASGSRGAGYVDGVAAVTSGFTITSLPAITNFYLGQDNAARYGTGRIADARLYSRGINAPDVKALYLPQTRWSLYQRPARRVWVSSGGGAFTLTAAQGSFALTGQAATLKAARAVTAAQAAFTLTGQSANLNRGYPLTAAQGSFALSGQAAGLTAQRRLTAAQASFTLTGQPAALNHGFYVSAAQGSFALSGQTANLRAARLLTATHGTFSLSGQTAGLTAQRLLTASQGAFTLTGQDAALAHGTPGASTLSAAVGTFALSGQAASLLAARRTTAAQASFALTGQAAALSRGFLLPAAQGAYALTGQGAALTPARYLAALYGPFTLSGQPATLAHVGSDRGQVVTDAINFISSYADSVAFASVAADAIDFTRTATDAVTFEE